MSENKKFKVVGVRFVGDEFDENWTDSVYYYKISDSIEVKEDDRVYIKNSVKENLAKVEEVLDYSEDDIYVKSYKVPQRFLVIDLSEILAVESKYQRLSELNKIMDEKVKSIEKLQKYEILKDLDPSFASIYEEFKELQTALNSNNLIEAPKSDK